ncbi:hypothetical protein [Yersinia phage vB_YenM_P778]
MKYVLPTTMMIFSIFMFIFTLVTSNNNALDAVNAVIWMLCILVWGSVIRSRHEKI